ncbi:MAG: hypothetical protein NT007_00690 [Candidatus Kapabacteria bacterium]|nr:hypothetical protein [Candidatus Kapabacteria bacterium]
MDKYDVFISQIIIDEINQTQDPIRRNLLIDTIKKYKLKFVDITLNDEIIALAALYIENNVLQEKSYADSLHIALSVINGLDILLSWNYKHLANISRKRNVNLLNMSENYAKFLEIITPLEVMDNER